MWLVRTKSGLELVCEAMNIQPDRNGFVRLTQVRRLVYPPGMFPPVASAFTKKGAGAAADVSVALNAIELYTDKVDIDISGKQFQDR